MTDQRLSNTSGLLMHSKLIYLHIYRQFSFEIINVMSDRKIAVFYKHDSTNIQAVSINVPNAKSHVFNAVLTNTLKAMVQMLCIYSCKNQTKYLNR